jgi:hypothetical protein
MLGWDPYCEVLGANSDVAEDARVLECDAMSLGECQPTFRHLKTSGTTHQTTRRHIAEDCNPVYVLPISSCGEEAETGRKYLFYPRTKPPDCVQTSVTWAYDGQDMNTGKDACVDVSVCVRTLFILTCSQFAPQLLTVGGKVVLMTSVSQAADSKVLSYVMI